MNSKFYKLFFFYSFIFSLLFSFTFASPISSSISGTQNVKIGDRVTVSVFYTANSATPIFTISSDIKYDNNILSFSEATFPSTWLPINRSPYELTEAGHVVRTAGYPGGLSTGERFVTLTFLAKQAGTTNINLTGGIALDQDNNDMGVQAKTLTVVVKGDEPVKKEVVKETPQPEIPKTKVVTKPVTTPVPEKIENNSTPSGPDINIIPQTQDKTVVVKGTDINIGINQNKSGDYLKVAEVKVQDTDLNEIYKNTYNSQGDSANVSVDTSKFAPGKYIVTVKTVSSKKGNESIIQKNIQVVEEKQISDSFWTKILKFFGIINN